MSLKISISQNTRFTFIISKYE